MRSVLVTGSSRGFGRLIAVALACRGRRVFATMRDPAAGRDLLQQGVRVLRLDVDDPDSVTEAVGEVLAETDGRLSAAVLNAGIASGGAFEDVPDDEFERVLRTNFFGTLRVARAVLPALRAHGDGRLLVMSSDSGMYGTPGLSAYTASKFAVEGWAESIALEVAGFGVHVTILEPGNFKTDIWDTQPIRVEGSPYARLTGRLTTMAGKIAESAGDPALVAQVTVKALEADRPRLRYRIGADARLMHAARRLLPDRARLGLIRRYAKLDAR
ncbi:SDR family oxidoreductase [Sphaerisporangium fuscum]|uniref:SDR family oxidoreductase n=1 Tax=Sphaerisporangium fuscum TaxID=2835868 RepID=UPI001BDBD4E6|nr:SDR family oxidoreductase [Sphaerisporangium fuscum]